MLHAARTPKDQAASASPAMTASRPAETSPHLLEQAQRVLADHAHEVLESWVRRVFPESPTAGPEESEQAAIPHAMPVLLEALDSALSYGNANEFFECQADALERIHRYAALRQKQGVSLSALIREYIVLRDECWALFGQYLPGEQRSAQRLCLVRVIDGCFHRVIEATLLTYAPEQEPAAA